MGMSSVEVVVVRSGQERAAATVLAAGHRDYPALRHVFPDPQRRARALPPFFEATVRDAIPFGHALAVAEAGELAAVAVWLPPGTFPWTGRRKLRATGAFLRVLRADPRAFRAFMRYGSNAEAAHPTEPHWYLVVLSVHPEAQRRGHGSRLIRPILERADQDGLPCYLETSDPANVAFYTRFGFEVVDPQLALVPGGPTHVAMRRHPRP
jgi:ribosomal protein S18 acetylase RimI-like enzyme